MKHILFFLIVVGFFSPGFVLSRHRYGPDYYIRECEVLEKESDRLGKMYKIKWIGEGLGRVAGSETAPWGLFFTSQEKCTLEQSKVLGKEVLTALLKTMKEDPSFVTYYKERQMMAKQYAKKDEPLGSVDSKSLAFRIDFWDENVDRPLYPYCAEIRYADGFFYYYYADPKTQALQEPISEVFEEGSSPVTS